MDDDLPATEEEQKATLEAIQETTAQLKEEKKYLQMLQCMEKDLMLRGHIYGLDSEEVHQACKRVGRQCNNIAMQYLAKDHFEIAFELLKKAEVLTTRHRALRAVTMNNMGCFFRKKGKLNTALAYMQRSLRIEEALQNPSKSSLADSHLNMCTILSELNRHEKALSHAKLALKLMLNALFDESNGEDENAEAKEGEEKKDEKKASKAPESRFEALAIAYHNLAVQEEFLGHYREALRSYDKAVVLIKTHFGDDHHLVRSLTTSLNQARKSANEHEQRASRILKGSAPSVIPRSRPNTRGGRPPPLSTGDLKQLQKSMKLNNAGAKKEGDSLEISAMSNNEGEGFDE